VNRFLSVRLRGECRLPAGEEDETQHSSAHHEEQHDGEHETPQGVRMNALVVSMGYPFRRRRAR